MNNNIQESYCSFEVSKLLKEKGFKIPVLLAWDDEDGYLTSSYVKDVFKPLNYNTSTYKTSKPTHALAGEWVWVNLGYWIEITCDTWHPTKEKRFEFRICGKETDYDSSFIGENGYYTTSYEAMEAALLYTLNNLPTQ